jgi:hypothetical protein
VIGHLSQTLEERWADYLRYREGGATFPAFECLAEIAHCLKYETLPPQLTEKWSEAIRKAPITDEDMRSIHTAVAQNVRRLQGIVSVGTRFIFDEILLLITIRVELELLSAFLKERGIAMMSDITSADDDLKAIATSPVNARDFRSAHKAASMNWGIPLHSRWLEGPMVH